jgi:hypothetical protein
MRASIAVFRLAKAGNRPDEYEDAAYPLTSTEWAGGQLRCAVADGASETLLSGPWAELLVRLYGQPMAAAFDPAALLEHAYTYWEWWLRRYLQERARQNRPVQWFEEPGLAAGAFAAFLGLTLDEAGAGGAGTWTALGLGDCCVCQVRASALVASFPMTDAAAFGVRPLLIGSQPGRNERALAAMRAVHGDWQAADCFYLMSDALAQWFFGEHEAGGCPWMTLDALSAAGQPEHLAAWVADLRGQRSMRNDDVTLLRIEIMPESVAGCPGPS